MRDQDRLMKILVTGAAGMLGRDVMLAADNAGHEVVGFGHPELDVTDAAAVAAKLEAERPGVVINCAAWTDVDGAEDAEQEATAVNGVAAGNLAAAAAAVGSAVVYVSSDYVFDGSKGAPYVETDQTAPLSAYGRSKLAGEEATRVANKRHFVVRSAWLFGTGGPNFVETMLRLAADHGEVLVVRDQVGSPTYTWHLAYGIVRLIEGVEFGIHHMAAAGACSWYEFAREIFEQAKVECKVMSATTEMLGRPAPRPAYSALASQREHAIELPSWQDGLAAYLAQRRAETEAAA
jgi:dTDP-4-dehydrorhamnose reductase